MLGENVDAVTAAVCVGYESTSQFNRKYRRMFGATPSATLRLCGWARGQSNRCAVL
ncbi:MAG: helix-turn-helix domain-containing protein [Zoogloeaceae bacterium]|nr:helix-turn-helix domain-containing protein [Zoogloeaceae bacterium]